jgi:hypothetical protein
MSIRLPSVRYNQVETNIYQKTKKNEKAPLSLSPVDSS